MRHACAPSWISSAASWRNGRRCLKAPAEPHPISTTTPTAHLAVEQSAAGLDDILERDRRRHRRQLLTVEIARETLPRFQPARLRAHHRIDAEQRDAAQDEGRDRGRQVHALRQAAGGDSAAVFGHRQDIGERVRADGIDAGDPALLAERAPRPGEFVPIDDLGCAKALEVISFLRPAGRGDDMPAGLGEQRGRDRADAAGCAGDDDRAVGRFHAMAFPAQAG
jgi:hypothetical protein